MFFLAGDRLTFKGDIIPTASKSACVPSMFEEEPSTSESTKQSAKSIKVNSKFGTTQKDSMNADVNVLQLLGRGKFGAVYASVLHPAVSYSTPTEVTKGSTVDPSVIPFSHFPTVSSTGESVREKIDGKCKISFGDEAPVTVALKVAQYVCRNSEFGESAPPTAVVTEFNREVTALVALQSHPSMLVLQAVALSPLSLALDLMDGGCLGECLDNDEWQSYTPIQLRLRILRDVASGLAHMHAKGFVHRDIKAHNIFLSDIAGLKFIPIRRARSSIALQNQKAKNAPTSVQRKDIKMDENVNCGHNWVQPTSKCDNKKKQEEGLDTAGGLLEKLAALDWNRMVDSDETKFPFNRSQSEYSNDSKFSDTCSDSSTFMNICAEITDKVLGSESDRHAEVIQEEISLEANEDGCLLYNRFFDNTFSDFTSSTYSYVAKIGDLGTALYVGNEHFSNVSCDRATGVDDLIGTEAQNAVGTSGYTAPEAILSWVRGGGPLSEQGEVKSDTFTYAPPADIYSFAIVCWETTSSHRINPLRGKDEYSAAMLLLSGLRPSFCSAQPVLLMQIIESAWKSQPSLRPSADVLLDIFCELLSSPTNFIQLYNRSLVNSSVTEKQAWLAFSVHSDSFHLSKKDESVQFALDSNFKDMPENGTNLRSRVQDPWQPPLLKLKEKFNSDIPVKLDPRSAPSLYLTEKDFDLLEDEHWEKERTEGILDGASADGDDYSSIGGGEECFLQWRKVSKEKNVRHTGLDFLLKRRGSRDSANRVMPPVSLSVISQAADCINSEAVVVVVDSESTASEKKYMFIGTGKTASQKNSVQTSAQTTIPNLDPEIGTDSMNIPTFDQKRPMHPTARQSIRASALSARLGDRDSINDPTESKSNDITLLADITKEIDEDDNTPPSRSTFLSQRVAVDFPSTDPFSNRAQSTDMDQVTINMSEKCVEDLSVQLITITVFSIPHYPVSIIVSIIIVYTSCKSNPIFTLIVITTASYFASSIKLKSEE